MHDYKSDPIGSICLDLASNSKASTRFGAVLVVNGKIIGEGWNRRSTKEERALLSYVDYAIHAEQAAIFDALSRGYGIDGGTVYVLGYAPKTGELTTRTKVSFGCRKCPNNFITYNVGVCIPHTTNWVEMSPEQAMESGKAFHGNGTWAKFAVGEATL